ncbi:5'-nucleotidase, lipoprotein e(P4) family [Mariniblastus fucicola]|uniref:Lipoprotein E n=1 Tax=Mariniblastus fucicola TaxID=980251 RepID=A0A5B9PI00_9BACT|nr:HAD family acid phosphatase [Mariniblastus fucicola]QEG25249.1 Lipoprotein E precursor [Mariniblastus fucicola]
MIPRSNRCTLCALLVANVLFAAGCADSVSPAPKEQAAEVAPDQSQKSLRHEDLDAILWVQTSGEYNAITRQTYRLAELTLKDALADPNWTASLEQQSLVDSGEVKLADLKPAVILDVDETVLNNSRFQVGLIESETEYTRDGWKAFVTRKESTAVAGAVDFVNACRDAGVKVIFLTNREHEVEGSTVENLVSVGLMKEADPDAVFSKYEKEDWKSDKITRRTELASKYRLLLLVGDDLHDFASTGHHPSSEKRREMVDSHPQRWGQKWIVLPNPNYGGWEQSLQDWNNLSSPETKLEQKRSHLQN